MIKYFLILLFSFVISSCSNSNKKAPKLVITIVVDQMRPDLLSRFEKIYNGGFNWLINHGKWYTNTHHEHSYTATGPGHGAIGFGQYPGKIGILGNSFYDKKLNKKVNCVEDPYAKVVGAEKGLARSFQRYKTFGLGDWLQDKFPSSKVISIGGKDRAACILGGKNPSLPLYYNRAGHFITSSYYMDVLPKWVENFNDSLDLFKYKDSIWSKSLDEKLYIDYSRKDFFSGESDNYKNKSYSPIFPISFDDNDDVMSSIMGFPWFEREVLGLAERAIIKEKLGQKEKPDLLFVGLSAMDWIIHDYGPFSQEVMDACIKVDRYLMNFIDNVDSIVGLENVLFVLTADHGGLPLPEYLTENGGNGGRINGDHLREALEWIDQESEELYGANLYHRSGSNFYLNNENIKKYDVNISDVYKLIEKYLLKVDGISEIISKQDILKNQKNNNKIISRIKNMVHPENSPDFFVILKRGYLYRSPHGTSHGTPYDYDTHVPLIFSKIDFKREINNSKRETVDIAPSIANLLGVDIPTYCDGKSIKL